jgi:hypothetical protein
LHYMFKRGTAPCVEATNVNDDRGINTSDAVFLLRFLFSSGPAPLAPGPTDCGRDPADSANNFGCGSYENC